HAASGIVRLFWPSAGDALWDIPDWPAEQVAEGQTLRDWMQARGGELVQLCPTGGENFDTWGSPRAGLPLMRALKTTFDPDSRLNPGRFVGGL
ncbi:MAG: FAD-linked oxidase C-terminal domain-containing protein, partial [Blastocatellia bacterium]